MKIITRLPLFIVLSGFLAARQTDTLLLSTMYLTDIPPPKHETFTTFKINFMRQKILSITGYFILITFLVGSSCKPGPYIIDYKNIKGFVIGKETCNTDDTKDYWLIDFTYGTNNPKVGDTLVLNGNTYTNVLKTTGLDPLLKTVGLRVSIDYNTITANKITTTGCNVTTPITYQLKDLIIIYQGEIR